ncbi:hypothetical protein A3711_07325 [Erythrobacter sp. HI00D59]|jgi:pimeloyl-ACP methyl ester carboxylesterase|nr:hypothetical protein A3711_07325 [Erythrobacter sp. HI00D59]
MHYPDDHNLPESSYSRIEIGGQTLNVFDEGDPSSPTLMMFHGAPHSTQEFRFNIPAFLDAGLRVVAADALGAGMSDRPEDPSLYSGEQDYQRAIGLADALGLEEFYIEGGDRGSLPLWMLAARNPERILGVISENVSHLNGFFSSGLEQMRRSWYMYFYQFDVAHERLADDDWALAHAFFDYHPDVEYFIADWSRPNGLEASWLNWYRSTVNPDGTQGDLLPNVSAPVLLFYSMNDPYIGPEQLAIGHQWIDGPLEMKRIDGAGHFIARNAPKRFNPAVIDFILAQEAARGAV